MANELQYDLMVEHALRGVMIEALRIAATEGLPGNNHFYVTFKTGATGVDIADHLTERYPEEMTIVLQFQYWDLIIDDDHFEVTLSFNDVRERLVIPFDAITGFADPSVKFGLQFQLLTASDATIAKDEKADQDTGEDSDDGDDAPDANARGEVVSLDQFRKKK
jgi:hypothetical protein